MSEKKITIDLLGDSGHKALRFHNRDMILAKELLKQKYLSFANGETFVFVSVKELIDEIVIDKNLIDVLGGIYHRCHKPGEIKGHNGDVLEAMTFCDSETRARLEEFCNQNVKKKDEALLKYYYGETVKHSKSYLDEDLDDDSRFRQMLFICLSRSMSSHSHEEMVASLILLLNGLTVCEKNIEELREGHMVLFDDGSIYGGKSIIDYGIVAIRKFFNPIP